MLIYKAENTVNKKVYIGQTIKTLEERKQEHLELARDGEGYRFHNAIRKYGEDKFNWSIIDTATTVDELNKKESYWIEYYKSYDNGYNCTYGDLNPMNYPLVIQKHNERMRSEEVRNKISNTMKKKVAEGTLFTKEHRKKISEKLKGNQHGLGKKRPQSAIDITAKAHFKRVKCIDEGGNTVKEFNSVTEAAKWLYYDRCSHLRDYEDLKNRIKESSSEDKFYKGLKWIYLD